MLDRIQLMSELKNISSSLFIDLKPTLSLTKKLWSEMTNDPLFQARAQASTSWPTLPTWQNKLDDIYQVTDYKKPYRIIATDGSQIYPDKHQGTSCALINIGTVMLDYKEEISSAQCKTKPYIMHESNKDDTQEFCAEWIDSKRQEYEFKAGVEYCTIKQQENTNTPLLYFFDGSLIFWHLESKEPSLRQFFIDSYIALLEIFYRQKILMAGYISLPKGKDLVNLVRFHLEEKQQLLSQYEKPDNQEQVDSIVDSHIASFFLQPFERTNVFKSNSNITRYYPAHLKPYFFYLHVGSEIARIEVPAWIAANNTDLELICAVIQDQCIKGDGYPIGLAEAHEQAVVKGPDRDFFYMLLTKLGLEQKHLVTISRKSLKKRGLGI